MKRFMHTQTKGVARNTLETIFLYKNGIGVEGIKCIAKAMASLPRLKQAR